MSREDTICPGGEERACTEEESPSEEGCGNFWSLAHIMVKLVERKKVIGGTNSVRKNSKNYGMISAGYV